MVERVLSRLELFGSLVGTILRQVNLNGRSERNVLTNAREIAKDKNVSSKVKEMLKNGILEMAKNGEVKPGAAFTAVKIVFGKFAAERSIRVPLMIEDEFIAQTERHKVDAELMASSLREQDSQARYIELMREREYWFRKISNWQQPAIEVGEALLERGPLKDEAENYRSVVSSLDNQIRWIQDEVRSRFNFSIEELREKADKVREMTTLKATLYAEFQPILSRLKEIESWLEAIEPLLAHEVSTALDGLRRVDSELRHLSETVSGDSSMPAMSEEAIREEAKEIVFSRLLDSAEIEPNPVKAKFLKDLVKSFSSERGRK